MYILDIYTPNPTKEDDEYLETPCTAIGGNEIQQKTAKNPRKTGKWNLQKRLIKRKTTKNH